MFLFAKRSHSLLKVVNYHKHSNMFNQQLSMTNGSLLSSIKVISCPWIMIYPLPHLTLGGNPMRTLSTSATTLLGSSLVKASNSKPISNEWKSCHSHILEVIIDGWRTNANPSRTWHPWLASQSIQNIAITMKQSAFVKNKVEGITNHPLSDGYVYKHNPTQAGDRAVSPKIGSRNHWCILSIHIEVIDSNH